MSDKKSPDPTWAAQLLAGKLVTSLRARYQKNNISQPVVYFHVLDIIYEAGEIKLTALINSMDFYRGCCYKYVYNMEQEGLVKRTHDYMDRRIITVAITEEGIALRARAEAVREAWQREIFGDSSEEVTEFIEKCYHYTKLAEKTSRAKIPPCKFAKE